MRYRAIGNRCAVHFPSLSLPVSDTEALSVLRTLGFSVIDVDVVSIARNLIGKVSYRVGAPVNEAPAEVDCSSLTKWLYAQKGIWLPRLSIQQRQEGMVPDSIEKGDLLFTVGCKNYYDTNPNDEVGHVGIATGNDTVIHAAKKQAGVMESPTAKFVRAKSRGARRVATTETETLIVPPQFTVESSDDIRWLVLKNLA